MKSKQYDGTDVRKILVGIICDKSVCARISSQWTSAGLFSASWSNLVASLAIQHYRDYGTPPGDRLSHIFEDWARTTVSSDAIIESIEKFLIGLSDESRDDPPEYILDLAGKHFNKVRMLQTVDAIRDDLEREDVEIAEDRLAKHRHVNLGAGEFVEQAKDAEVWIEAYERQHEIPLVYYHGQLGDFFGSAFQRGRLFAFTAPDKTGKTSWLVDFTYRALRNRNRVAFFDCGDGSKEEFTKKLGARATCKPVFDTTCNYPTSWEKELEFEERTIVAHDPLEAFQKLRADCKSADALRSSFHPSSTVSAADIDGLLEQWSAEDDWRPDVLVIDYADILAGMGKGKDDLSEIDETWKRLRRISQERHCLVITATQSSSLAYGDESGLITKKHFSGRKTKNAHVSGMIGINVTDEERSKGMARINRFAWRHGKHSEKEYVRVVGCYDIGNPVILSKR